MRLRVSQDDGEASTSDASSTTTTERRHTRRLKLVSALFVVVALGLALQGAFAQSASAETGVPRPQTGIETIASDWRMLLLAVIVAPPRRRVEA